MLRTLFESRSTRSRGFSGAAASTAIHLVLITAAAYGTVTHARANEIEDPAPVVFRWNQPKVQTIEPAAPSSRTFKTIRDVRTVTAPSVSIDISPGIPDIDIPLGPVARADDFPSHGVVSDTGTPSSGLSSGDRSTTYDSYQVDVPVAAIGGIAPVYPAAMRASGVEGEVKAEFVVDRHGRADPASLRIIASSNDLFSDAVRVALPRMRFRPAQLKGESVSQLVQQLFVFRLSR
ncbi:MAG TPA: energy transducer TonB [Gemmatimonadaceae bacterium]